jgi:stage V sporulation protein AE
VTYVYAFLIGGGLCVIGQLVMDLTKPSVTTGHILVGYITTGTFVSAFGLYQKLVDIGGAGAMIPLSGFGHSLAQGVIEGVAQRGFIGIFSGGLSAAAGGIAAAIVFGYLMALLFDPKE